MNEVISEFNENPIQEVLFYALKTFFYVSEFSVSNRIHGLGWRIPEILQNIFRQTHIHEHSLFPMEVHLAVFPKIVVPCFLNAFTIWESVIT